MLHSVQDDIENTNGSIPIDSYEAKNKALRSFQAPKNYLNDVVNDDYDPLENRRVQRVADREDEYRRRFRNRQLSPERADVFAEGNVFKRKF